MVSMIQGATAMACLVAGLFFLRFWRSSGDRLFAYFSAAFWVLAAHWAALGAASVDAEHRHVLYLPRLVAFGLILAGIAATNRRHS